MKQAFSFLKRYQYWFLGGIVLLAIIYSFSHRLANPARPVASPTMEPTRSPSGSTASPSVNPSPASSPANESLIASPIALAEIDSLKQAIYYLDPNDNNFKRFNLTDHTITNFGQGSAYILAGAYSPNHSQIAILSSNEQGNKVANPLFQQNVPYGESFVGVYDFATKLFKQLNSKITVIAFLTDNEIIYQFQDGRYNNLSIAKPDGTGWRNIAALAGDYEIIRSGNTALVQRIGAREVLRYGAGGKLLEKYTTPADFKLSQSDWGTGPNAVYWLVSADNIVIKRLRGKQIETVTSVPKKTEELSILWDNKTGDIYFAGFLGLQKVTNSQP